MAYRACFHCELLFEVDGVDPAAALGCPQCGRPVQPYEPEGAELVEDPPPAPPAAAAPEVDPAIVKTMTVDGLADAVRDQVAARQPLAPAPTAPGPAPTGPAPAPAARPPRAGTPFPARAGRTRVLGAVDDAGRLIESLEADLAPEAPPAPRPKLPTPRAIEPPGDLLMATAALDTVAKPTAPRAASGRHVAIKAIDGEQRRPTLPPTRGRRRRGPMILVLALVLGGGGFAGWWFGLRTPPAPPAPPAPTAPDPASLSWDVRIEKQLESGQAKLPVVSGPEALTDGGAWIAGGPEGLQASFGPVAGLPSTLIRDTMVQSDDAGEWVAALSRRLSREQLPTGQPLALGLPGDLEVKDLLRIAYAGVKGGVDQFLLLVARNAGGLGGLPFGLQAASQKQPGKVLVLRIGRTRGFHVTVQEADQVLSGEPRILPRREDDGLLDLKALRERLDELMAEHGDTKAALIYPLPDMTVTHLAEVMGILRGIEGKPRFDAVRLSLR